MHFKYQGVGEQNIKLVFCQSLSSVPKLASVLIVQYNSATRKPAHAGLHKDLVHESLALPRLRQCDGSSQLFSSVHLKATVDITDESQRGPE